MSLDVFFGFFEGRDDEDDSERKDSCIPVRGRNVGNLLDAGGEEEEDVGIFGELFWLYGTTDQLMTPKSTDESRNTRAPARNFGKNVTKLYLLVEIELFEYF